MKVVCKFCESPNIVKIGRRNGKQRYRCKDCGRRFVDNGNLPRMRTKTEIIAFALDLYFEGLSVRKVQRQIKKIFGVKASQVAIHNWITKYSRLVKEFLTQFKFELGDTWHCDETAIKVKGEQRWFWEIIDEETRFMVACLLSESRGVNETKELFRRASEIIKRKPKEIITDGLHAYRKGFNKHFYDHHRSCKLIQRAGIRGIRCNNLVERLHGTLKDRLKPARGMDEDSKTEAILDGWWVHYNFVRPHSTLGGKTPAEVAGFPLEVEGWKDLIEMATKAKHSINEIG